MLQVWRGSQQDPNLYAYLEDIEDTLREKFDLEALADKIGLGRFGGRTVIQVDGLWWFLQNYPQLIASYPLWVLEEIQKYVRGNY